MIVDASYIPPVLSIREGLVEIDPTGFEGQSYLELVDLHYTRRLVGDRVVLANGEVACAERRRRARIELTVWRKVDARPRQRATMTGRGVSTRSVMAAKAILK